MAQASVTRMMGSGSLSPEAARRRDPCPGETGSRRQFLALRPATAGASRTARPRAARRREIFARPFRRASHTPFERLGCHSRRAKRDRESRAKPALLDWLWIPGQACGLPGMTKPEQTGSAAVRTASRARSRAVELPHVRHDHGNVVRRLRRAVEGAHVGERRLDQRFRRKGAMPPEGVA